MNCLILCAGYATRLYPLTLDRPKPLLPIAGKPMIEHILKGIAKVENIDEVLIVTNNKFFNNFRDWKRKYSGTKPIKIINDNTDSDEDKLGAVGDIDFTVKKEKIEGNIFIVAGDNLFKFDLRRLFDFFKEKNASVVALYDIQDKNIAAGKYGVVEIDKNSRIINLEEKPKEPKTTLVSTACYILAQDAVEELKKSLSEGEKHDNIGDFLRRLIKRKNVYGLVFREKWFDIGSPEQLKEADIFWSTEK